MSRELSKVITVVDGVEVLLRKPETLDSDSIIYIKPAKEEIDLTLSVEHFYLEENEFISRNSIPVKHLILVEKIKKEIFKENVSKFGPFEVVELRDSYKK